MKSKKLKFLGTGACFNTKMGNTSAYYYDTETKHLFLIDCGEAIFDKIRYSKILLEAEAVDILITHLHSDHAGSLESLVYFCQYYKHIIPTVIFPNYLEIANHLKRVEKEAYNSVRPDQYSKYAIIPYRQEHAPNVESYGYRITMNNRTIFYSGDAKSINPEILQLFNSGHIAHFYQDVTKYEGSVHMNIKELTTLIPSEERKLVTCMHFDDRETLEMAQALGFKVAKRTNPDTEIT